MNHFFPYGNGSRKHRLFRIPFLIKRGYYEDRSRILQPYVLFSQYVKYVFVLTVNS